MPQKTREPETPEISSYAQAATADSHPFETPSRTSGSAHTSIRGRLLGLTFLVLSAIGSLGVLVALVPTIAHEEPNTQLAAAAAKRAAPFADIEIAATSAFVYDVRRDSELFSKNASAQLPLASITKIMLVLAVAEVVPLDSTISISREAVARGSGGLTWGEEWNVRDLIDFTLITSSNTGAEALAEAAEQPLAIKYPEASGSSSVVWRMNSLARHLGMRETYFMNVTGLDEGPTQPGAAGSARDVAKLFAYALRTHTELFAGTRHTDVTFSPANFPRRFAHNTNDALPHIDGLLMGKTGTTDLAGGNLAIAFDAAADYPVVIVVLGSTPEGRYADIARLAAAARTAVSND